MTAILYASETWTLYKHQLKLIEGFHQRCLRQILHIKWQSHVSDTEVLGKAGLPSIQSMVMKSCLQWVGHIVRMDDGRLPRQLFYGEMWEGKRSALKPKKRFKDTIKYYLKQSGPPVDQWEKMASDRSKWRKLVHESIESFENNRIQYSAYKHLIRKGEQDPAPSLQSRHANCDIYEKLCLSLAGLKSHLRKYAKSIWHTNNVTASKTERLCQFCGKICRRLAATDRVLYIDLRPGQAVKIGNAPV